MSRRMFHHVLDNVFVWGDDKKDILWEQGINNISGLLVMDQNSINHLPLKKGDQIVIRVFSQYILDRTLSGDPIFKKFGSITREAFVTFRGCDYWNTSVSQRLIPPYKTSSTYPVYPFLLDDKYGDIWISSFQATVRAQGLSHLLDPSSSICSMEDKEQKWYLYDILNATVHTGYGRMLLKEDDDPSYVFKQLQDFYCSQHVPSPTDIICDTSVSGEVSPSSSLLNMKSGETNTMYTSDNMERAHDPSEPSWIDDASSVSSLHD